MSKALILASTLIVGLSGFSSAPAQGQQQDNGPPPYCDQKCRWERWCWVDEDALENARVKATQHVAARDLQMDRFVANTPKKCDRKKLKYFQKILKL